MRPVTIEEEKVSSQPLVVSDCSASPNIVMDKMMADTMVAVVVTIKIT